MIRAHPDIIAGMPGRSTLPCDDVAGHDDLAAELLHAQAAASRIAPVARRAACFFMRHGRSPFPSSSYIDSVTNASRLFAHCPISDLPSLDGRLGLRCRLNLGP